MGCSAVPSIDKNNKKNNKEKNKSKNEDSDDFEVKFFSEDESSSGIYFFFKR